MTLQRVGREAGLDALIYTRTGWDKPAGRMLFGELVPLYGVYAEGLGDRNLSPMPVGHLVVFARIPYSRRCFAGH